MFDVFRRNRPLLVAVLLVALIVFWMSNRYEPKVTANILLSGLTLGALYFLVAAGLSLIFGLMDVLNFAHGLMFMLGAYFGYTVYANPRIILNTLPLMLALGGGAMAGAAPASWVWARLGAAQNKRGALIVVWLLAGALTLAGIWRFDLQSLAANAATVAGGAIATGQAQEAAGALAARLGLLSGAGLALGLALRSREFGPGRSMARNAALGIGLVVLAFAIVPARISGEAFILGLSNNLRFVLALAVGALGGAAIGALTEVGLIRPLYSRPIYQVLLTLGLVYVGTEFIKGVWGPVGYYMDIPDYFNTRGGDCPSPNLLLWFRDHCGSIDVLGRPFPSYRLFIIFLGVAVFIAVAALLRYTRLGMIIRAGVQDREMVQALGINVQWVFTLVFALGTGLAALGGVAAAPFIGVNPGIGQDFLLQSFISVVIGGMGSYPGAAIGTLLVGLARAFGDQLVLSGVQFPGMETAVKLSPSIARASTVLIMAVVLLLRPAGLFGKKE
ncbi:MAG: branched-chain amino acid ABC transporter permease [Chloroflexi bacterium]|nr:branched-chain amino acid ABC transporter permease [Chloroflexota bacterium]